MNLIPTHQITTHPRQRAFSLVELLVVVSIIAVLAAFTIVGMNSVNKVKKINTASAELREIDLAIENYHAKYGVYPPGNGADTAAAALTNQLYYELTGVTLVKSGGGDYYQTLDSAATITTANYSSIFGAGGVLNCTKGSGEDVLPAKNFLPSLKPTRIGLMGSFNMIVTSVEGPDDAYLPVQVKGVNPFRYKAPNPTNNNPGNYDLWIQLSIGATNFGSPPNNTKKYLISNWTKGTHSNIPLP